MNTCPILNSKQIIINSRLLILIVAIFFTMPIAANDGFDKALQNSKHSITTISGGFSLSCELQDIEATVTLDGLKITSVSTSESKGEFSIRPAGLGRDPIVDQLAQSAAQLSRIGDTIRLTHPEIVEEFTSTPQGIRQDFIVYKRPDGNGKLRLVLKITGASIKADGAGVTLKLAKGRDLVYNQLKVIDAQGSVLSAKFENGENGELAIVVNDAGAVYPVRIDPTISDNNWASFGVYPGASNTINCVVRNGSNIYVGGNFTNIGNVRANYIAKWDGSTWSALGAGANNGTNNQVYVITFDASGNLYAGGNFTFVNGATTAANRVAKYDPNTGTWSSLGSAVAGGGVAGGGGWVYSLAFDNTNGLLYVGGDFLTANTFSYPFLAKCVVSTGTWSAVGTSINGIVRTLVINGTVLYAGGAFTQVDGTTTYNRVVSWSGTSWATMGTSTNINALVYTFYFDGSDTIYAGGDFTSINGVANSANRIAKYSIAGNNWTSVGAAGASNGVNGSCRAITIDASRNIYATGNITSAGGSNIYYVARWNGSNWGALGTGLNNQGYGITFDASNNLWVGGAFTSSYNPVVGSISMLYLGKWNGSSWSGIGTGPNSTVYAMATDGNNNVYVGGAFTHIGGYYIPYIAKWNSTTATWSSLGSIAFGNQVLALKVVNNNLYAGGSFTTAAGVPANYVAKWNGTSWTALNNGAATTVRAIESDPTGRYIFIGGDFTTVDGTNTGRVAKWDTLTSTWSGVASTSGATAGISDGIVYALAHDGTYIYAGGTFTQSEGVATSLYNMARSTGASGAGWSIMGGSSPGGTNRFNGVVRSLVYDGSGNLYAAGAFTTVGGPVSALTANRVAKWSTAANSWSIVGSGGNPGITSGTVYALAKDTIGNLWATGDFTTADGLVANSHKGIACFNGTTWQAAGSGLFLQANIGYALACNTTTGTVNVGGGFFDSAGLKACSYLARVDNTPSIANADAYSVNEDQTLTVAVGSGVLANDNDADGDTKTAILVSNGSNGTVALSSDGSFTYTPTAHFFGTDQFTYKISDTRCYSTNGTVTITVNAVNDLPSFTKGSDQTVLEDAAAQSIAWATGISAGQSNESAQIVHFDVTNNNSALFSMAPEVAIGGTLTFTTAANANGVATVSVRAHDDGGVASNGVDTSASQTFTITVSSVNDAPSFTKGSDQVVLEGAGYQSVSGWATGLSGGPADESSQGISFDASNNRSGLFSVQPSISSSGVLTYIPASDSAGSATVSVRVRDNAGTANSGIDTSAYQTFTITLTDINDAPSFTKGSNLSVAENAGSVSYNNWATNISAGPLSESGQTVGFNVSNTNTALFSVQPAVSSTGSLSFTAATYANGSSTVSIRANDNGGVANNGIDTSAWQSFTITVSGLNSDPTTPGALLPAIGANVLPSDSLQWGAATDPDAGDAIRYIINVSAVSDFSSLVIVDTVNTLYKKINLFANHRALRRGTIYYWRVRSIDNSSAVSAWVGGSSQFIVFMPAHPQAFALATPAHTAQVHSLQPAFLWNASTVSSGDTLKYRLEISTLSSFASMAYTQTGIATNSCTPGSDLTNNTAYYWRVWAIGNYGDSTLCTESYLVNIILVNHPPSLSLPLSPLDNIERKPGDSLSWTRRDVDVGDTVSYTIRLSADISFNTIAASKTNWTSASIALSSLDTYDSLRDNRSYFWQVEAHDQHNASSGYTNGQNNFIFNKTNDAPTIPFNMQPAVLSALGPTDFLRWQAQDGDSQSTTPDTLHYSLTLDNDADFSSPIGITLYLASDSVRIDALTGNSSMLDNVRYYWKVVAIDNHALAGPYSSGTTSFWYNKVNDAPGAPSTLLPVAASAMLPIDSLRFTASVDPDPYDSTTYIIQTSAQSGFTTLISTDTLRTTALCLKTVSGYKQFVTGSTYYWRVKGYDRTLAESPWAGGSSQSFIYTSTLPLLPVVMRPADDSVLFPTEAITWSPSVDADRGAFDTLRYVLEVATVSTFSRLISSDTLVDTLVLVQNLHGYGTMQDNNRYYWRLMVYDNHSSATGYSATRRFYLDKSNNAPSAPLVFAPVDSAVSNSTTRFIWRHSTDPDPGNTITYTVIGATDSLLTDTVLVASNIADTSITLDSLLSWNQIQKLDSQLSDTGGFNDNRFYYWGVVAYDNRNAPSNQSSAGYFYCNTVNDTPGVPTNLQPSFGAMTFPTAHLEWQPHGIVEFRDPTRNIIQFSNDSVFAFIASQDTVVNTSRVQFNTLAHATADLTPERFVFWRVRAYDREGATQGYSAASKIYYSVHNDPPLAVSGLTPADSNTTLYPVDILTWNSVSDPDFDSVYYEVWISGKTFDTSSDTTGRLAYKTNITSTSIALNSISHGYNRLTTNSVYFYRVRSRDEHFLSGSWSPLRTFRFKSTAPTIVAGLLPADNTLLRFSDSLRWGAANDPDAGVMDTIRYIISIAPEGYSTLVSLDTIKGDTAITLKNLSGILSLRNNQSYSWNVRSMDAHGSPSDYSGSAIFVYNLANTAPDTPQIIYPEAKSALLVRAFQSLRYSATDPEHDPLSYRIEIARDSLFFSPLMVVTNRTSTQIRLNEFPNYSIKLKDDSVYYWRVRAIDDKSAQSPYSLIGTFRYSQYDHLASEPVIVAPANNAYMTLNTSIVWNNAIDLDDSVLQYRVAIYADTSDTAIAKRDSIVQGGNGKTTISIGTLGGITTLLKNTFYYWNVSPRSLVDTSWVVGNSSPWFKMLMGDSLVVRTGDSAIAQVMVVVPGDFTTHEVRTADSSVMLLFSSNTFSGPTAIRIAKLDVEGTIGTTGAAAVPADTGLRTLQRILGDANKFAMGDPTMYWVREPAFAIQTFSIDENDTGNGALHDSILLQIAYHDTNHDGYVDGESRIPISSLAIYRLNELNSRWEPVSSLIDTNSSGFATRLEKRMTIKKVLQKQNSLAVLTNHFSVYTILAIASTVEPFSNFKVYPSPFLLGKGGTTANIAYRLNENAQILIHIYDQTGGLVWERKIASTDLFGSANTLGEIRVPWDGRNGAGRLVGNGMYVVKLQAKVQSGAVYNRIQYLGVVR